MKKSEIKNKLLEKIKKEGDMFFTEIESFFEEINYDYEGEETICPSINPTIILWANWNKETIEIVSELLKEHKELNIQSSSNPIFLMLCGGGPALPIAKSTKRKYKNPHWLPSALVWKE